MPAIRPEVISNRIRLTYELGALDVALVAEHGAVNPGLSLAGSGVDAVINELPPHPTCQAVERPKHDMLAGAYELTTDAAVCVPTRRIMPLVEREACPVPVLRQPPLRLNVLLPSLRISRV